MRSWIRLTSSTHEPEPLFLTHTVRLRSSDDGQPSASFEARSAPQSYPTIAVHSPPGGMSGTRRKQTYEQRTHAPLLTLNCHRSLGKRRHCAVASVIFLVANSITFVQVSWLLTLLARWRLRAQGAPHLGRKLMSSLWLSPPSIPFARGRTCSRRTDSSLLQTTARKVVANYS